MTIPTVPGRIRLAAAASLTAVLLVQLAAQAPAAANANPNQGGTSTIYANDANLQSFAISNSRLWHYWNNPSTEASGSESIANLAYGETGYPSAVTFGAGLHVFYRNLTTLHDIFYLPGSWEDRTLFSDAASNPGTMVSAETLYVTYVTTGGVLKLASAWHGIPTVGQTVASGCDSIYTPSVAAYYSQLHVIARCGGLWRHYWQDLGSTVWSNEIIGGSGVRPGAYPMALGVYGTDFVILGNNASDGTVWRWWYVRGQIWRAERVAAQAADGRPTVGYFWGSWHAAWVRGGYRTVNAWLSGSIWSTEDLVPANTSDRSAVDAAVLNGSTYYLVSPGIFTRWRWQPSTGWREFG